ADKDGGETGIAELRVDVVTDPDVLEDVRRELLLPHVPVGLPIVDDADPQAAGVHLLAHYAAAPSVFFFRDAFGFAGVSFSVVSGAAAACGRLRATSAFAFCASSIVM